MTNRPITTLFLLTSVDGKISNGDNDTLDVDRDWKRIHGVREGLPQYYDLEKQTDLCFFQSGRVFEKLGFNERPASPNKLPITGVIIDSKPHLNASGIGYLASWLESVIVVSTNPDHPAKGSSPNVHFVLYPNRIDFVDLFMKLKSDFSIERVTIQSGGTLNAQLLRDGLIDHLSIVMAPLLVGGATTSTLIDGEAIHTVDELTKLKSLKLVSCEPLQDSYIHLQCDVIQETVVEPDQVSVT